jgi:hypothetical protein
VTDTSYTASRYAPDQAFAPPPAIPPKRARRPAVIGLGLALAAIGGLGAGAAVLQAGTKNEVLALAHPVHYGQQITASDLAVAHIAADPALSPVPAADLSRVVGRYAAANLPVGSLLTMDDLSSASIPGAGEELVGVAVKVTQMPSGGVVPGDRISVVSTPGPNDDPKTAVPASITATVVSIGQPDSNGTVVVSVQASSVDGPTLAAWSATGRVAVLVQPHA